ncbi:MAG: radical SAM protein [Terriglobia bacterium]
MANGPLMGRLVGTALRRSIPLNAHFDLTYRCNERCVHCYLDHEDYGEVTTAEVKNILEQLARAGTLFLTFSGGEIFLRRDFFELAAYARQLRFDLSLKTNAVLITAERAARLQQLSVRKIQISLYSADPAVHDAVTKVRGSWARSLTAIKFLRQQGLRVKIACPLMQANLNGYAAVRALAEELGVGCVFDLTITPMMDGDHTPVALRVEQRDLLPILQDPRINRPRALAPAKAAASGAEPEPGNGANPFDGFPCGAGHNSLYINPYGDVYPCVQMPIPTGNLRHERFNEIWYGSTEMLEVRAVRTQDLPVCSHCELQPGCPRCPGLAYMEQGSVRAPSLRACEIAEAKALLDGVQNPRSAARSEIYA